MWVLSQIVSVRLLPPRRRSCRVYSIPSLLVSLRFRITSSPFGALPVRFDAGLCSSDLIFSNSLHARSLLRRFNSVPFFSTHCRFASIPVNSFPIRINSIRRVATPSQSMSNRFQAVSFHANSSPFRSDSCRCGSTPARIDSVLFPADSSQRFSSLSQIGSFRLRFQSIRRNSVSQLIVSPRIKSNSNPLNSGQCRFASCRFFSAPAHVESNRFAAAAVRFRSALIKSAQR